MEGRRGRGQGRGALPIHIPGYATAPILYRFRDTANDLLKFADFNLPHLHLGVTPVKFIGDLWRQKTESMDYCVALLA